MTSYIHIAGGARRFGTRPKPVYDSRSSTGWQDFLRAPAVVQISAIRATSRAIPAVASNRVRAGAEGLRTTAHQREQSRATHQTR